MTTPAPAAYQVTRRHIPEEIIPGKRLGRHFKSDSRSAAYAYRASRPESALADQLHDRHIGILDQGSAGSCTAEAEIGCCGTDPFYATMPAGTVLDQPFAYKFYSAEETLNGDGPYPPNDNGSDGTTAAQVAKNDGLISGYTHAVTVQDMADALQDRPLIVGVNWYSSFDSPSGTAALISVSSGAYVRGGHEFLIRGVKVADRLFLADNSWGPAWGDRGSMELSWDTMSRLLSEQGDCTVSVPLSQPAPTPAPVPADPDGALWAVAGPWAHQHRVRPDLVRLQAALETWAAAKNL